MNMRATWITSVIGGALFGLLVRLTDVGIIDDGLNILFFFVDAIFFVFGVPQLREDYRGAKGFMGLFTRPTDFRSCQATWCRMLIWFISVTVTVATTRALGL
jgi:hypothetical protein